MRAIRQYEFGGPENLRHETVDDPHPGPGQVRIAVQAAGVHFIDTVIRQGSGWSPLPDLPTTPGREVAGVVDELGPDVDKTWLGAPVVAHLGPAGGGGYAELAVRDVAELHRLPDSVGFDAAVAMIGTGRTTMGILDFARLTKDDVMLVTAAAGGIGNLLVQTGRNLGATVVGVAGGAAKVERLRAAGATIAVDYADAEWIARVREALGHREVTIALEGVGGELGRGALELLGGGGRLVMYGSASGTPTHFTTTDVVTRGLTVMWTLGAAMSRWRPVRDLEEQALDELATGRLVPVVQSFPLMDAVGAHTALEKRATHGKVVLLP